MPEWLYTPNMFMNFTMVPMWSIELQICGCPISFLSFLEIRSDLIYRIDHDEGEVSYAFLAY